MIHTKNATDAECKLYGIDGREAEKFGRACLMAQHRRETEKPIAGLLTDLTQRGLLDDTPVLWGGEFGRPSILNANKGRDHNANGFTMWMVGGGVKGGLSFGATEETGMTVAENKVHLYDIHATLLHVLGLGHERLTFRYGGCDFRLTDVHGCVVQDILD